MGRVGDGAFIDCGPNVKADFRLDDLKMKKRIPFLIGGPAFFDLGLSEVIR